MSEINRRDFIKGVTLIVGGMITVRDRYSLRLPT